MYFSLRPKAKFRKLTDISADFLKKRFVEFLMLDLDNTIAAYGESELDPAVGAWVESLKASGIALYIVSNTHKTERVAAFGAALGIPWVNRAAKPSRKMLWRAMRTQGVPFRYPALAGDRVYHAALAGDQIFTDVLAANRAGALSLLVEPIRLANPIYLLRYILEIPFRIGRKYE